MSPESTDSDDDGSEVYIRGPLRFRVLIPIEIGEDMEEVRREGTFVTSLQVHTGKDGRSFKPLVIMEFPKDAKRAAIEWIISKIEAPKGYGGAELLVDSVDHKHSQETMLYIGATTERLLLGAELMEMKKAYTDGYLREVNLKDIDNFQGSGDLGSFLTTAEKQKIILHELEAMRAGESDTNIPGYENVKLYPGNSIVMKYLSSDIALQLFPLHDIGDLKSLGDQWYWSFFKEQPIHKIRSYFGDTIALYFAFLGVYTWALIPPCLIGSVYFITSWDNAYRNAIFAVFNLVWATVFLEAWKRYCNELTFRWGTINTVRSEEQRSSYHGDIGKNPITGKPELRYPKWKRTLRFYCVSVPVVLVCLYVVFLVMLWYFRCQDWVEWRYEKHGGALNYINLYMPTVGYAIVIGIINTIYRKIAKFLNDWENHRIQTAYDNHLIFKLVVFDFINCFVSLFYVAFYMQDMVRLRSHLAALLITQQIIGQIREAIVPFLFFRRRAKKMSDLMDAANGDVPVVPLDETAERKTGSIDAKVQKQANVESTMDVYDGTLDDYLEMFLQFGYVFLFSSAFPMAAFWALLNNVTEIRTDSFKMCRVFQRPFAQSAAGIGAWQVAFEVISILAVMTNTALIAMSPEVRKLLPSELSVVDVVLLFVVVEHIILGLKGFLAYVIPDVPKWVQVELSRIEYKSKLALQNERLAEAERRKQTKSQ